MESEYSLLKANVIKNVKLCDIKIIKPYFEKQIDSRRTFSKIKSIEQLLEVLEDRDVLNENTILALSCIGNILKNSEINELIKTYKKLQDNSTCSICGCEYAPVFEVCTSDSEHHIQPECEAIIQNISENIGIKWKILQRELDILNEGQIESIRLKYVSDPKTQALKALELWKEIEGHEATVKKLEATLNSRLCKLEGLGSHLMKPVLKVH